jgi:hypothetical protein
MKNKLHNDSFMYVYTFDPHSFTNLEARTHIHTHNGEELSIVRYLLYLKGVEEINFAHSVVRRLPDFAVVRERERERKLHQCDVLEQKS